MKTFPLSRVILATFGIVGLFAIIFNSFSPSNLIVLLNGLFVGSLVAIAVAYKELLWEALVGDGHYDRYRQMTLSIFMQWVVIGIGVGTSIFIKVTDLPTTAYTAVAFARYLATVAAVLQITSPDLGQGLWYGRDRKVLLISFGFGISVAVGVIFLQEI